MFAAIINSSVSRRLGKESNEIEATKNQNADWAAFHEEQRETFKLERDRFDDDRQRWIRSLDTLETRLENTRTRVSNLERRQVVATRYIEKLKDHIWQGHGPPPPPPDKHDLD